MIKRSCFFCEFYRTNVDKSVGCLNGHNDELQRWWFNNKYKEWDDPTIGEPACFCSARKESEE